MGSRALVLGGGGPVGIAWESGLLAGLAKAGIDLGRSDFIVGTSAGSFVGARLAMGAEAATLADAILGETARPEVGSGPTSGGGRRPADLSKLMALMAEAQGGGSDPDAARARIGAFALAADTPDEADFIASFGRSFAGLAEDAWPVRGYACTAVDALTGAFEVWTRDSGVGVTRAVASSCSVPGVYPPITIKGRRYIDGGMRSPTNADVAKGYDLVVVVAVRVGPGGPLDAEIETLKAGGADVVLITPDAASLTAMGVNLMDFRARGSAVRAGMVQAAGEVAALQGFWG